MKSLGLIAWTLGIAAALGAEPTLHDLRSQQAALEKQLVKVAVQLKAVKAKIAKISKVPDKFPRNLLAENAKLLTGEQYAIALKVRFGRFGMAHRRIQSFPRDAFRLLLRNGTGKKRLIPQMGFELRVLFAGKSKEALVGLADGAVPIGRPGTHPVSLMTSMMFSTPDQRDALAGAKPTAAHLVVSWHGVPLYEDLLVLAGKGAYSPNGVPWWRDDSLVVAERRRAGAPSGTSPRTATRRR